MSPTPGMQVDSTKVIEAMQRRFAAQVAQYETTIAMQEVVIDDLQLQNIALQEGRAVGNPVEFPVQTIVLEDEIVPEQE